MPNKDLNNTKTGNPKKAETLTVRGTVTNEQREVINGLIGIIGSNEQDVVGKIITIWLYNEGMLKRLIDQKTKI
jgi:hypothetical protein